MPNAEMKCPLCGSELQSGSIVVRMDLESWLVGTSIMHAWFDPADGGESDQVLSWNQPEHALRCAKCMTVVIASQESIARGNERKARKQLVGMVGIAESPLKPMGGVMVAGESHRAKSISGFIEQGEQIEVVEARLRELVVRKKPD